MKCRQDRAGLGRKRAKQQKRARRWRQAGFEREEKTGKVQIVVRKK